MAGAFWHLESCTSANYTYTGTGTAGSHGPGAISGETLVVTIDPLRRTYAISLAATGKVLAMRKSTDCSSGAVYESTNESLPATDTGAIGVRPLPPDFKATRRIVGSASVVIPSSVHARLELRASWHLTLDERDYDIWPPNTKINAAPPRRTTRSTATFAFSSSERGSTFQCRVDLRVWRVCRSPKTYRGLTIGTHIFRVRARDHAGNVDTTPARFTWRVA